MLQLPHPCKTHEAVRAINQWFQGLKEISFSVNKHAQVECNFHLNHYISSNNSTDPHGVLNLQCTVLYSTLPATFTCLGIFHFPENDHNLMPLMSEFI